MDWHYAIENLRGVCYNSCKKRKAMAKFPAKQLLKAIYGRHLSLSRQSVTYVALEWTAGYD